jgi:hypothetical protein
MIGYVLTVAVLAFVAYQLSTSARRRRSDAPLSTASDGLDPISVSSAVDDSEGHHHDHDGHHGHHQGDHQSDDFGGHHGGDFGGHHGGDLGGTDFGGTDFGGHH